MAERLKGPAHGPAGDRVEAGKSVPSSWPKWFVDDLRAAGHLTGATETSAAAAGEPVAVEGKTARGRKGGVEVSGGSYAGVAVANTTANMGTPSGGSLGPIDLAYPTATGSWGTPDHWANTDGSGNIFDTGSISSPQAIGSGQTATLSVTITAA